MSDVEAILAAADNSPIFVDAHFGLLDAASPDPAAPEPSNPAPDSVQQDTTITYPANDLSTFAQTLLSDLQSTTTTPTTAQPLNASAASITLPTETPAEEKARRRREKSAASTAKSRLKKENRHQEEKDSLRNEIEQLKAQVEGLSQQLAEVCAVNTKLEAENQDWAYFFGVWGGVGGSGSL